MPYLQFGDGISIIPFSTNPIKVNKMWSFIKHNFLIIGLTLLFLGLYTNSSLHSQSVRTNHISNLNVWVVQLSKNDDLLYNKKITQSQWLMNRKVIFQTYLNLESTNI